MMSPMDSMLAKLPKQVKDLEVYVDDASLQVRGRVGEVAAIATKAGKALCAAFEQGAALPVSQTKGRIVASSVQLAQQFATKLRQHGIKAARAMGVLGVDSAAGRGGVHGQSRKRMNAVSKRAGRFARLKKLGGNLRKTIQAVARPALMYGCKVVGLPLASLHRYSGCWQRGCHPGPSPLP